MPILTAMAQSASIAIEDDVPTNLPDLHADGRALKKIVINLVTNAIKHSRPQGTIWVSASVTENKEIMLVIKDNGVGMDPRLIAALNRPTPRIPAKNGAPEIRTGVGLSVVKRLLEMHEASFTIETSAKSGTTATAIFPANRVISKGAKE